MPVIQGRRRGRQAANCPRHAENAASRAGGRARPLTRAARRKPQGGSPGRGAGSSGACGRTGAGSGGRQAGPGPGAVAARWRAWRWKRRRQSGRRTATVRGVAAGCWTSRHSARETMPSRPCPIRRILAHLLAPTVSSTAFPTGQTHRKANEPMLFDLHRNGITNSVPPKRSPPGPARRHHRRRKRTSRS